MLHALVVELLVCEGKLFLETLDLLLQLALVEGLLSDDLAPQVLNLRHEPLLDRSVLFAHDLTPDVVELVEDRADTSLGNRAALRVFADPQNFTHCLCRDPIVVFGIVRFFGRPSLGRLICRVLIPTIE